MNKSKQENDIDLEIIAIIGDINTTESMTIGDLKAIVRKLDKIYYDRVMKCMDKRNYFQTIIKLKKEFGQELQIRSMENEPA